MSMENIGEQMYVYITQNTFVNSCWRKVRAGQSLSKMSTPTALHVKGTAQVSEWFNISDTAKKLYKSKSNSGITVAITTKLQTRT